MNKEKKGYWQTHSSFHRKSQAMGLVKALGKKNGSDDDRHAVRARIRREVSYRVEYFTELP